MQQIIATKKKILSFVFFCWKKEKHLKRIRCYKIENIILFHIPSCLAIFICPQFERPRFNSDPQSLRGSLIYRYTNHRTPFRKESFSAFLLSIPISKSNHSVTIFWMFPPPSRNIYTWHFLDRGISAVNAQLYLSCSGVTA